MVCECLSSPVCTFIFAPYVAVALFGALVVVAVVALTIADRRAWDRLNREANDSFFAD